VKFDSGFSWINVQYVMLLANVYMKKARSTES